MLMFLDLLRFGFMGLESKNISFKHDSIAARCCHDLALKEDQKASWNIKIAKIQQQLIFQLSNVGNNDDTA